MEFPGHLLLEGEPVSLVRLGGRRGQKGIRRRRAGIPQYGY